MGGLQLTQRLGTLSDKWDSLSSFTTRQNRLTLVPTMARGRGGEGKGVCMPQKQLIYHCGIVLVYGSNIQGIAETR